VPPFIGDRDVCSYSYTATTTTSDESTHQTLATKQKEAKPFVLLLPKKEEER